MKAAMRIEIAKYEPRELIEKQNAANNSARELRQFDKFDIRLSIVDTDALTDFYCRGNYLTHPREVYGLILLRSQATKRFDVIGKTADSGW